MKKPYKHWQDFFPWRAVCTQTYPIFACCNHPRLLATHLHVFNFRKDPNQERFYLYIHLTIS